MSSIQELKALALKSLEENKKKQQQQQQQQQLAQASSVEKGGGSSESLLGTSEASKSLHEKEEGELSEEDDSSESMDEANEIGTTKRFCWIKLSAFSDIFDMNGTEEISHSPTVKLKQR